MVVASVILVLLGLVYFMVTAWIVTTGVGVVTGSSPSGDFVALSAALLTLGGLLGSRRIR